MLNLLEEMEYQLYKVEKGELSENEYMNMIIDLYKLSCNKINSKQIEKINYTSDSPPLGNVLFVVQEL